MWAPYVRLQAHDALPTPRPAHDIGIHCSRASLLQRAAQLSQRADSCPIVWFTLTIDVEHHMPRQLRRQGGTWPALCIYFRIVCYGLSAVAAMTQPQGMLINMWQHVTATPCCTPAKITAAAQTAAADIRQAPIQVEGGGGEHTSYSRLAASTATAALRPLLLISLCAATCIQSTY
jgi:hypothetical protein